MYASVCSSLTLCICVCVTTFAYLNDAESDSHSNQTRARIMAPSPHTHTEIDARNEICGQRVLRVLIDCKYMTQPQGCIYIHTYLCTYSYLCMCIYDIALQLALIGRPAKVLKQFCYSLKLEQVLHTNQ